jgi:TRAP-type mannitol/chloroaromatic compound transport system permease large subunit
MTFGEESDIGLLLREGTAGEIYNVIVMGFKDSGLAIDHDATFTQANLGNLVMGSVIFSTDLGATYADAATGTVAATWSNIVVTDPMLMDPYSKTNFDFRPAADSPAADGTVPVVNPPNDGFFEAVDYIGGVDPDNDWTKSAWVRQTLD